VAAHSHRIYDVTLKGLAEWGSHSPQSRSARGAT
jgi:hypothetical protein